jgi:transformation/transcription domain-associated protein
MRHLILILIHLFIMFQEIAPDHTVKLDRVAADIPIVRRHGSSFRRLTLIGSDGSQRHFIVQTSLTPNARSDERILQLFRMMNQMFEKHKESRRRHICIHTPIIIPVWSQVRIIFIKHIVSCFSFISVHTSLPTYKRFH